METKFEFPEARFCLKLYSLTKIVQLEPLHPIQIQRFREMTFAEKWAVAQGLWLMARNARLSAARRANPELTEEDCRKLVAREFARSRT